MRRIIASAQLLVFLLSATNGSPGGPAIAVADECRPLVVVSLASYERLVHDLNCVGDPRLTALAVTVLSNVLGTPIDPMTAAPVGLDTRRPWGLVEETDGLTFPIYGFIPVTNLHRLLAGSVAAGKIKPPIGGVYEVKTAEDAWYLMQKGPWGVFASSPHGLKAAPADPAKVLGGLDSSFDLAARLYLKNLPDDIRKAAKWWIGQGPRLLLPREPGESSVANALRSALTNQALDLAAGLADEGETLVLGISVDLRNRSLVGDLEITFAPDTSMAESLGAPSRSKTAFGGFLLPGATLTGIWTGEIARMPLHQFLGLFDSLAAQLAPGGANRPSGELWRTIREALLAEDVDGGVAVALRSNGVTLVVGGNVDDGANVENKLRRLAEAAGGRTTGGESAKWRLDAGRYRGTRLHTVSIPIPEDAKQRRELSRMFGDRLELAVGVDEHSLYVALGRKALPTIKQVLRASRTRAVRKGPPVQLTLDAGSVARFLAQIGPEDGGLTYARLAGILEQSGGKDHVRLTASPIPRGVHVRMEIQEGLLRAPRLLSLPARPPVPGARRNPRRHIPRPVP